MRLRVEAARRSLPWEFEGSDGVGRWLAEEPWHRRGGARCIGTRDPERVRDGIRAAVHALDRGRSAVEVVDLAISDEDPEIALLRRLGTAPAITRRERQEQLARELARPILAIVDTAKSGFHRIAELSERLGKQLEPAPLSAMVLCPNGPPGSDDFHVGFPHGWEADVLRDEGTAWATYLHVRAAWEAGGIAGDAEGLGDDLARVPRGADAQVEACLNAHASARLAGPERFAGDRSTAALVAALAEAGLTWPERAAGRGGVLPWAARALLLGGRCPPRAREALRGAVVCQPLVGALLPVCLEVERGLRIRLDRSLGLASAEALAEWERWQASDRGTARQWYPANCPAVPVDATSFASVGAVVRALREANQLPRALDELPSVRNALAHGHYVSWSLVQAVRGIRGGNRW